MRRVLLNLTVSLDGFIAEADGGIDWILPPAEHVPGDYLALMQTVDAFVMGRATYETSLRLAGGMDIFEGKAAYVFTSNDAVDPYSGVEFVREAPEPFVARLKEQLGGTIWLFGGGRLATALVAAGLVDDYLIAVQPMLLGDGIPLWRGGQGPRTLEVVHARAWPDGIVELRYRAAGAQRGES
ncbi:MAG: dihydrofolate reductase family protein [Actinobacteria bacterium]|nr:dihydrofolate reductase family protein [Actinomycetota bacterium]